MKNSKSNMYWDKFLKSGSVEDYLNYKFARKNEENNETNSKEKRINLKF